MRATRSVASTMSAASCSSDGDSAFAWAGVIRAPIDQVREGITVVATPFYLALQVDAATR